MLDYETSVGHSLVSPNCVNSIRGGELETLVIRRNVCFHRMYPRGPKDDIVNYWLVDHKEFDYPHRPSYVDWHLNGPDCHDAAASEPC